MDKLGILPALIAIKAFSISAIGFALLAYGPLDTEVQDTLMAEKSQQIAKLETVINQIQKNMTTVIYSPIFPPPVVEDWKVICKDC